MPGCLLEEGYSPSITSSAAISSILSLTSKFHFQEVLCRGDFQLVMPRQEGSHGMCRLESNRLNSLKVSKSQINIKRKGKLVCTFLTPLRNPLSSFQKDPCPNPLASLLFTNANKSLSSAAVSAAAASSSSTSSSPPASDASSPPK